MDIKRSLEEEMMQDPIVIAYLKDVEVARDFYRALCNVDWYLIKDPIPEDEQIINILKGEKTFYWSCSWRHAGGVIADIRNANYNTAEDYMDFYCSDDEGTITEQVRECFERMGWKPEVFY
jgi:hypothetical protein